MSEDQEFLAGIAARDPEAFRFLMERYAGGVINLACRFLETRADAEDVAQDVFLRLYQNPPTLDPETKLFTWLYRVTVNRCLDLLRQKSRRPPSVSLDAPVDPAETEGKTLAEQIEDPAQRNPRERVAQTDRMAAVRKGIELLPLELRAPLILAAIEELPQEEIARILSLSPKAVERRIARARQLLKQRLSSFL